MQQPNSVLITGASSGIGRALALGYAQPQVRLALVGRNRERLAEVAAAASAKGAEVEPVRLDVRDRTAMKDWMTTADADHPFDLVIANAGITTGLAPQALTEDPEAVRAVLATNLVGVLNSVEPLIGPMAARGRGHIAVVGSVAGLISLPYSPAYCAAKAAVHAYATALRGRLEPRGVCVSLVIPGFIKTPLNELDLHIQAARSQRHQSRGYHQARPREGCVDDRLSLAARCRGTSGWLLAEPCSLPRPSGFPRERTRNDGKMAPRHARSRLTSLFLACFCACFCVEQGGWAASNLGSLVQPSCPMTSCQPRTCRRFDCKSNISFGSRGW